MKALEELTKMFDADIADHRVVPQEEVHARIGEFIDTVMAR